MNKLFEDLRFFIGAFFLIVGVLLTGQGLFGETGEQGNQLNLLTGLAFILFSGFALMLALKQFKASQR